MQTSWLNATDHYISIGTATLRYRHLGTAPTSTPVIALTHLAATLDEWDPAIIEGLAAEYQVYTPELPGIGASSGVVPETIEEMAQAVLAFADALGLEQFHLLGFSLGGFVAQAVAVQAPQRLTSLTLTGTGPAGGHGIQHRGGSGYIYWDMLRATLTRTDIKAFLFFPRTYTGKQAAQEYLHRIQRRPTSHPIRWRSFQRQLRAIGRWAKRSPQDLSVITAPTFIANGDHDRMVPTALSYELHRRISKSTLHIYPNSGHGGVFQYHDDFLERALAHLQQARTAPATGAAA